MAKTTKKKVAKKANTAGRYNQTLGAQLAQAPKPKPFAQALKEFDAAIGKAVNLRGVMLTSDAEQTAFRALRVQSAAQDVMGAAYHLFESARVEAEK